MRIDTLITAQLEAAAVRQKLQEDLNTRLSIIRKAATRLTGQLLFNYRDYRCALNLDGSLLYLDSGEYERMPSWLEWEVVVWLTSEPPERM